MATATNTKKPPTAAQIAKVRRSGATWNETREQLGVRWGSGKFTEIMNEAGFDAGGAKLDGSGPKSKAQYKGRAKVAA
jgi:hypothetical protein